MRDCGAGRLRWDVLFDLNKKILSVFNREDIVIPFPSETCTLKPCRRNLGRHESKSGILRRVQVSCHCERSEAILIEKITSSPYGSS